jgi:hypothetical protein
MGIECDYAKEKIFCPGRFIKCLDCCVLYDKEEKDCSINVQARYAKRAVLLLEAIAGNEPFQLVIEGVKPTVRGDAGVVKGFGQAEMINRLVVADETRNNKIPTFCRKCNTPITAEVDESEPLCDDCKGVGL